MTPISNGKKALIHVAKTQLGLSDAEYLDILATFGNGANSSRDLNDSTFEAVLDHFKRLGFVQNKKFFRPGGSKRRLIGKITAIRNELGLTESYVDAIVQRMSFKNRDGKPIDSYRWLSAGQLHKLVAALTYHQVRRRKSIK